ncbi:MAG: hypothetical protein K0R65_1622 [Crocinitomicaceae bacterium]|jgi:hypothetical protein|nr:hypothetical protein [Crocinitomicaceae bacterium]
MEHENDIDNLFQKSFESFEVLPPDELKQKIDEQLNFKEKKRRFFGLPSVLPLAAWLLGGISLMGGVILAILLLYTPGSKHHDKFLDKNGKLATLPAAVRTEKGKPDEKQNASGKQNETTAGSTEGKQSGEQSGKQDENEELKSNKNTQLSSSSSNFNQSETQDSSNKKSAGKQRNRKKKHKSGNPENTLSHKEKEKENEKEKERENEGGKQNEEKQPEQDPNKPDKEDAAANTADSLTAAKEAAALAKKDDSSANDSLAENYVKPERKKPEPIPLSPFLVGVQFGLTKAVNSSDETVSFGEHNPLYINFDASYRRRKIGIASGFNYFSTGESVSYTYTQSDSTLVTTYEYITDDTIQYIYDTNQMIIDSIYHTIIVDSTAVEGYQVNTNSFTESSVYRVSYFSIPFMLSYQQRLFSKFYLDLMAGGVISYQKLRFTENNNPANDNVTLSELGFRLCVKTNLRYQFSKFGVSINSNFNYDLKPVQYLQTSRKRQALDFGVGIWYNF